MTKSVVIYGIGEVGGVFARGFLKKGYMVAPVTRENAITDFQDLQPEAVILAVGEKELAGAVDHVPRAWKDRIVLLQNELLPQDWEGLNLNPTVISVWFEKKYPNDFKVIIPSPAFGPQAALLQEALNALNISVRICKTKDEMLFELILKNLYIVTTNVAGLKVGGTVGELWEKHNDLAQKVAQEVLSIQFQLAGQEFDRDQLIKAMVAAFEGDLDHTCMGRSAPARLERAISLAQENHISIPTLQDIHSLQRA